MTAIVQKPLLHSAAIQGRVIGALLLREILTRYGRHNIGFLWLFFEPMLFTLGITALWTATRAVHGSNLPIVGFAVTGYSTVLLWRNAASRCAKAVEPNLPLLYHRNVTVIDVLLSRVLLEILGATISLSVLTMLFMAVGLMDAPSDVGLMVVAWLLLAAFAVALGLVIGAISEFSETFDRVWHTITYLLFPLSGAGFLVEWLPQRAQDIVLWLPMVHAVEMLRHGYFGSLVKTHESVSYLATADLTIMLLGLILTALMARKIEPQ